jgi:hypothetical protein
MAHNNSIDCVPGLDEHVFEMDGVRGYTSQLECAHHFAAVEQNGAYVPSPHSATDVRANAKSSNASGRVEMGSAGTAKRKHVTKGKDEACNSEADSSTRNQRDTKRTKQNNVQILTDTPRSTIMVAHTPEAIRTRLELEARAGFMLAQYRDDTPDLKSVQVQLSDLVQGPYRYDPSKFFGALNASCYTDMSETINKFFTADCVFKGFAMPVR